MIEANQIKNKLQVKITDQGPGIPKKMTKKVLESYQRLARDEHRGINGNGLGLSIANTLIQKLGGQLRFEHPLKGLTVVIELPLNHGITSKPKI